jgi:hypothetical protein
MALRSIDIVLGLYLVKRPHARYDQIAGELKVSKSTVHHSLARLQESGLVWRGEQSGWLVNLAAFEDLVVHAVRYIFPATRGASRQRGVPTAHSAGVLHDDLDPGGDPLVWSSPEGTVLGTAIDPLIPSAPTLRQGCPDLYDMLALVDALRVGTPRDSEVASRLFRQRLGVAA